MIMIRLDLTNFNAALSRGKNFNQQSFFQIFEISRLIFSDISIITNWLTIMKHILELT